MAKHVGWKGFLDDSSDEPIEIAKAGIDLGISSEILIRWHEQKVRFLRSDRGEPGDGKPGAKGYRMYGRDLKLIKVVLEFAERRGVLHGKICPYRNGRARPDEKSRPAVAARDATAKPVVGGNGKSESSIRQSPVNRDDRPTCSCKAARDARKKRRPWKPVGPFRQRIGR